MRTRYIREVEDASRAGADEVIPEEFETSIEIVARVLRLLHVPGNIVATQIRLLRDEAYRTPARPAVEGGEAGAGSRRSSRPGRSELFLVLPDSVPDGRLLSASWTSRTRTSPCPPSCATASPSRRRRSRISVSRPATRSLLVGAHEDLARVLPRLEAPAVPPPLAAGVKTP